MVDKYELILEKYREVNPTSIGELEILLDNFQVLFAYHSGKIENEKITYHDTREVFKNGKVLNFTGEPKTIFEIENQKYAYDFLKSKIIEKEPLTMDLIKETQKILTSRTYDYRRFIEQGERPGEFKKHDVVTGIHEVGSSPEFVEADLMEMLQGKKWWIKG